MKHTLEIVENYQGPFDATILVNCMLGLLVVPKERYIKAIPEQPLTELAQWGIRPESIQNPGRVTDTNPRPETLRGLVKNLRHSVAHFTLKPIPANADVHSFEYRNDSGLHAVISLAEMRVFVKKLATHLDNS